MADKWVQFLRKELRGVEKLLVLGTGNALKADDAAGLLVASILENLLTRRQKSKIKVLRVYELIDTYSRRVKRLKPSHLIIVDALDMKKTPGTIMVTRLQPESGKGKKKVGLEFAKFLENLTSELSCKVIFIGIQPASLDFGHPITQPIREACRQVSEAIAVMTTGQPAKSS